MILSMKPQMAKSMAEEIPAAVTAHLKFRTQLHVWETSEHGVVQTAGMLVQQEDGRELRRDQRDALLYFLMGFFAARGWKDIL